MPRSHKGSDIRNSTSGLASATTVEGDPEPEHSGMLKLHLDNTFGSVVIRYIES